MQVVGYVRLSRDEDPEGSTSIGNQQELINEFAAERNWSVSKIYIDDNYSGYNFDRPDFSAMIEQVEKGNIDIILTKDLARISRNNAQVLTLVDRLKGLNNKHLIVISEGGADAVEDVDGILGIKAWLNERYIKDISKNIRLVMHSKQKKGELIMGNTYGYKKEKVNGKFQLTVDEEIRPAIELIFKSYIGGMGYMKICQLLEEKGYPTPSEYIKQRHENSGRVFNNYTTNRWQTHMVQRFIQNVIYVGTLVTKKRHARLMKGKQEKVAKEHQYVFENHHEAMISKEDFQLAQDIRLKRNEKGYRTNKAKYSYIFGGFMECSDCGFNVVGLNLRKQPIIKRGYNCTTYHKYGNSRCSNRAVSEDKVLFFFREFLKDVKTEYEDHISGIESKEKKSVIRKSSEGLQRELTRANEELKLTLSQKIRDLTKESNMEYRAIIESTYEEIELAKKKKIVNLAQKINALKLVNPVDIENKINSSIEVFESIITAEIPERKDLELILDKIIVHSDRSLEFILKVDISRLTYSVL